MSGWVITPCAQTLQSLGTFTGANHQELQCHLHNPDIESRIICLSYMLWMILLCELYSFSLISVSLPSLFMFVSLCVLLCNDHWLLVWVEPNPDADTRLLDRSWAWLGIVVVVVHFWVRSWSSKLYELTPLYISCTSTLEFIFVTWLASDDCNQHFITAYPHYLLCWIIMWIFLFSSIKTIKWDITSISF